MRDDGNTWALVYVPQSTPFDAGDVPSQRIAFGRGAKALGTVDDITAKRLAVGMEKATETWTGTNSGKVVNLTRVEATRLAADSHHMRNGARQRRNDVLVSHEPSTNPSKPRYTVGRQRHRRPMTTIALVKAKSREITYLERELQLWRSRNQI